MDISPNDLRTYEFQTQMRGYDREEVRNLLEKAATALEKSKQDHLRLSMEMDSIKSQLAGLRQFEDSIKNAAIDARRNADLTIANAKREAEIMMNKARTEAEQVVGSRAGKADELDKKIAALETAYKSYLAKLRALISSHLSMVNENITINLDGTRSSDPGPIQVDDSTDITATNKRTTFASEPQKAEPVHIEESNAPSKIIAAPSQTKPMNAAPKIDPELAASIERYSSNNSGKIQTQPSAKPQPTAQSQPTATTKIQTQQFTTVHEPPKQPDPEASGRLHISSNYSTEQSFEHSSINIDTPSTSDEPTTQSVSSTASNSSISQDSLAEELDRVVAKFEEEINKAEKN